MVAQYVPGRGDLIWLQFSPQTSHEQAGRRPAIVLSPQLYNTKVGLAICCSITTQQKGYPFEVPLPESSGVDGVIPADQIKSLDWEKRQAQLIGKVPEPALNETLGKSHTLL